jgi:cyclic beta-1,2-glucan synthetase
VAQAWSVLSGAAPLARQQQAMASAREWLADESLGLWHLLDPPLVDSRPHAGYIQAYPPGVRENGGQYAHAGVWAAMAQARLGEADAAWRSFTWLSPAHRAAHPAWGGSYGLEPYAMAADVYSQPPYAGRGGWSWYTGSAAGMHRLAVEFILGLEVAGTRLRLRPQLPSHWTSAALHVRLRGRRLLLTLCAASAGTAIAEARAGGAALLGIGAWIDTAAGDCGGHHLVICAPPAALQVEPQAASDGLAAPSAAPGSL